MNLTVTQFLYLTTIYLISYLGIIGSLRNVRRGRSASVARMSVSRMAVVRRMSVVGVMSMGKSDSCGENVSSGWHGA